MFWENRLVFKRPEKEVCREVDYVPYPYSVPNVRTHRMFEWVQRHEATATFTSSQGTGAGQGVGEGQSVGGSVERMDATARRVSASEFRVVVRAAPGERIDTEQVTQVSRHLRQRMATAIDMVPVNSGEDEVSEPAPIVLNTIPGVCLESVAIDGRVLSPDEYELTASTLTLPGSHTPCTVSLSTITYPGLNHHLQGAYVSGSTVVTQNETFGTRHDTPFPDQPGVVVGHWTNTLTAPAEDFPTMVSTGLLVDDPDDLPEVPEGMHRRTYELEDFAIPAYIHASVLGKLECITETFTTRSGKSVQIEAYVTPGMKPRVQFLLEAYKLSMAWDEDPDGFGLECPVSVFRCAIVDHFNFGAMENFMMNVFNASRGYAHPSISTDAEIIGSFGVVNHEYCHTWSGDIVPPRSWHQIGYKEGLTRLRDGMFKEHLVGADLALIQEVRFLRSRQFAQDAGAGAHSVIIREYEGNPMDSMYNPTTYDKSAQIYRMLMMLVGKQKFFEGYREFMSRFRGKGARMEDFIETVGEIADFDVTQFMKWLDQQGTPKCAVSTEYDAEARTLAVTIKQSCPKEPLDPLQMPFKMGLVDAAGQEVLLNLRGDASAHKLDQGILNLTQEEETFVFENVPEGVTPSFLRDFSAPVKVDYDYSLEALRHLVAKDSNEFSRYDACERITRRCVAELMHAHQEGEPLEVAEEYLNAYGAILTTIDPEHPELAAEMLSLPSVQSIVQDQEVYDFQAAHAALKALKKAIAVRFKSEFAELYGEYLVADNNGSKRELELADKGKIDVPRMHRRALMNTALEYLVLADDKTIQNALEQFENPWNMTNEWAAFKLLCASPQHREAAIQKFYERWKKEPLVMNKWFMAQSHIDDPDVIDRVRALMDHPDFDIMQPTNVYSLFRVGLTDNPARYHDSEGEGYRLAADFILRVQQYNPTAACGVATRAFNDLTKLDPTRKALMRTHMRRICDDPSVSSDVVKVIQKMLGTP